MRPAMIACAFVIVGAVLEGALAGGGIRARLKELRQPALSPPFAFWIAIGALYYVMCFGIAYRLASLAPMAYSQVAPLVLLGLLLFTNALWNYAFFRRHDLRLTWHISVGYAVLAAALSVSLFLVDTLAALFFLPYLLYLLYGTWWTLAVRNLNPTTSPQEIR